MKTEVVDSGDGGIWAAGMGKVYGTNAVKDIQYL